MKPGDSVCLRFFAIGSAFYGNYSFSSVFTPANPAANEIEPNNTMETAQSISVPYEPINGHIYYGLGGLAFVDGVDYYEIGHFQVGDSINLNFLPTVSTGFCDLLRMNFPGSLLNLSSTSPSGHHVVTTSDIYFVRVSNTGFADCTPYTVNITGDLGRREYSVSQNELSIDYDPDEDLIHVFGDFADKSIEIVNSSNVIVEDLSGNSSPIVYDVTALPVGKHFLVIRDNNNALLQIQDLIKE